MGRRSRKRVAADRVAGTPAAPAPPPAQPPRPPRPLDRRARLSEAPKAPWSPFPLVELAVLVAMGMIIGGLFSDGRRQRALLVAGVALAGLAGLELSIREHFAGYRSHTTLLSGVAAVAVVVPLVLLARVPQGAVLAAALTVFGVAFYLLRAAFARRTGGLGFRV
jgi:MFS family permease